MTNVKEEYRSFEIIWQEPPRSAAEWSFNIGTNDKNLFIKLDHGNEIISAPTKAEGLAKCRRFIDSLLEK